MTVETDTGAGLMSVGADINQLFLENYPGMVRLAALLGAVDPENVAQEAFVRLDSKLRHLRDEAKAVAYVRATVVNLCRSEARHAAVVRRRQVKPDVVDSPETLAVISAERREVLDALATLTERQRQILVLKYWLDLSERAIAETLNIRTGTVKSTTHRALALLEAKLEANPR